MIYGESNVIIRYLKLFKYYIESKIGQWEGTNYVNHAFQYNVTLHQGERLDAPHTH